MIEIRDRGTHTVFELGQALDAQCVTQLRSVVMDVIETSAGGHIVDASDLELLDSSGVGLLVSMYKQARAFRRPFAIVGLSGQPLETLQLLKIDQRIPVSPDRQAALQAFADAPSD